ncbi:hypothetical protein [Alteraurantiacibacter aquimixticola]|uniref:DUF8021 domain-containing protein n=1 Tax=Alteraurantiacibacter aquimixticola TaxID=2489173 RepID=A0A4V6UGB4_9SPHN|nr:hypothetical protein [Alteraurantiacibacter aquimixticola]TIX50673.1 hypothetical protein E5222_10495 [Alteraurantiacibacter aquimixticola]
MKLLTSAAALALAATTSLSLAMPALAQAPGEDSAVPDTSCQYDCLIETVRAHMAALESRNYGSLPLATDVMFTENNVPLKIGQGLWRTVDEVDDNGLAVADESTGHAAWFGSVRENGTAAFYALRIHVSDGLIDEIETVVHRRTGLPAPFGDWENMEHFAEFYEVLPEEERRPRERMLAIADAYFDTVELNDGQVFAPFSEDCSRLENGITTTAPRPGEQQSAASIASGCRAQFELGLYRINKRIRRDLPLVDERRGVVVGTGFFDHANEFDRYLLTNGREMRTALKWPNSITLIEAFRIRDAEIQRIEATFTYVPYFMHNPFWSEAAPMPRFAPDADACDSACLTGLTNSVPQGMVGDDWQSVNWGEQVGYTENSVGIRVGESIWRTVTAIDSAPLVVADAATGKGVWIGRIEEHGQPAWAAFTVSADGDAVGSVDATIRRSEYGAPWAEPVSASDFSVLPANRRTPREAMVQAAGAFMAAISDNGPAPEAAADDCQWFVNGQPVGDCTSPFGGPILARVERTRDREILAIDEERGLAVVKFFEDLPAAGGEGYPLTYQVIELYRFEDGRVTRVEAFTSELPYGMRPR